MRRDYLRPLKISILLSILGEAIIFVVWGLILYPEGNIMHKFLWTIVFCGFGMGAAAGFVIVFMISGKLKGYLAIVSCMLICAVLLGLLCNVLCFRLDMHFDFFGGADTPTLFIWNGVIMSVFGGWLVKLYNKRPANSC